MPGIAFYMSNCRHHVNGRAPIPAPLLKKKKCCQSRVLLYTDSVPHSCITTILIDSLATWNLKKNKTKKKSPDNVFKSGAANWWRLLLTLTYGHADGRGAEQELQPSLPCQLTHKDGAEAALHFC